MHKSTNYEIGLAIGCLQIGFRECIHKRKIKPSKETKATDFESPNIYNFVGGSIVNITIRENKRPQFWDNSIVCVCVCFE